MARTAEQDWGFLDITRKFEREAAMPARKPRTGRLRLHLAPAGTAHVGAWLTMVALSLIGLVALHVAILQKNMEFNGLIQEKNELIAENARLSSEVSALSSPERIQQIATGPLGMVSPEKMQYVYIGPAGSSQSYADLGETGLERMTPP